ncbi:hypothetical protein EJ04DRAFT_451855 [Polyplosphaeria fusca]|uniref:RED-like N-terminal domain-containing protein n=1 Tax=Polyplosphaeria fusca TaxID=682080 RepID=A0A9P4QLY9_9PLEO|nr:hypothetical protein EJ04DRAFT_451855 [Polyplosphaeria fusca]
MNNQQFRSLLLGTSKQRDGSTPPAARQGDTPALGARKQSSIPMTPRQIGRNSVNAEFARQLAERNASRSQANKFKSSAPKGVKLVAGYTDRTQHRNHDEGDDKAQRIKALEEALKLDQLGRADFDKLVADITAGDINATHLVKGLDRRLLDRVRNGEHVFDDGSKDKGSPGEGGEVDDELDQLAEKEVTQVVRHRTQNKAEPALPPLPQPVAGQKRRRDEILAELKAQRIAAAEAAEAERQKLYPTLGTGFRKVGSESTKIEVDKKGREVLIITDASGNEKRKVRKQRAGPEVPVAVTREPEQTTLEDVKTPEEPEVDDDDDDDDDDDIFEGVGSNFNPLAGLEDDDSDDSSEDEEGGKPKPPHNEGLAKGNSEGHVEAVEGSGAESHATTGSDTTAFRPNWFNDRPVERSQTTSSADATVLAALRKVRQMDPNSSLLQDSEEGRLKKRAAQLAARDRDMDDMDMEFGESRFDDADEMERDGQRVKFSEWRGLGADEDGEEQHDKAGKKRKRGPKKKKGDKNSATDVMQAMERQKKARMLG